MKINEQSIISINLENHKLFKLSNTLLNNQLIKVEIIMDIKYILIVITI